MGIVLYIALFSAIFNLCIGVYILSKNPKNKINRYFFLFVLSIVVFNISEFFIRQSITVETALFWGRIGYNIIILGPCFALSFSLFFPRKNIPKRYNLVYKYLISSVYIMGLIIYFLFINLTSVNDIQYSEWGYRLPINPSTFFVAIWFIIVGGASIGNLAYKYFQRDVNQIEKKQIKLILTGGILMIIIALGTNILPPLFNINIFPMTSLFTSIFVLFVGYAIIKYKFLSLSTTMIAKNILNTIKDSLIVADQNENIINVNKSTLDLLGYHKNELINSSLNRIIRLSEKEEKKKQENI